jgi:hypothetical protein
VNGLAVREAPMVTSPIAQGYQFDGVQSWEPVGEIRLNAGDSVWVQLGPMPIGDTVWYLVWPGEGQVPWDSNGDFETVGGWDPAWVAAAVGEDEYLSLYRRSDPSENTPWPTGGPQTLMIAGTGDYMSDPQVQHDLFGLSWAVTADDHPSPCAFEVTLLPDDAAEPVLAVDVSTSGFEQGPQTGPSAVLNTPWEPSAGSSSSSFTVSISSGCTWAVMLWPLAHD